MFFQPLQKEGCIVCVATFDRNTQNIKITVSQIATNILPQVI